MFAQSSSVAWWCNGWASDLQSTSQFNCSSIRYQVTCYRHYLYGWLFAGR